MSCSNDVAVSIIVLFDYACGWATVSIRVHYYSLLLSFDCIHGVCYVHSVCYVWSIVLASTWTDGYGHVLQSSYNLYGVSAVLPYNSERCAVDPSYVALAYLWGGHTN